MGTRESHRGSSVRYFLNGAVRRHAHLLAPLVAVAVALGAPAAADASSIVYINSNNVWLANPDGSGQYQVTLDGTSSDPYSSPSETSNGTIEAIHGTGPSARIVEMAQNGTVLNTPFTTAVPGTGPLDAILSPDGSKVAYWGVVGTDPCYPFICYGTARTYQVSYANHYVDPSTFAPNYTGWTSVGAPAWLSNGRDMLFAGDGYMYYYDIGQPGDYQQWFSADDPPYAGKWDGEPGGGCCGIYFEEGAASQDDTRMALVILNQYESTLQAQIAIFSASPGALAAGNPPPDPALSSCVIKPPDGSAGMANGGALFDSLSWSPDDSSLALEYNGAIYVAGLPSLNNCTQDSFNQVLSGSDPYWSSANINPGPRSGGNGGGNKTACHVPKLKGKKLAAAKGAIRAAGCAVGKVTRKPSSPKHKGRVISQRPPAGTSGPTGTKVKLVVGQ